MKCKTCGIILKKHSHKFVCYRELTILGRCHYKEDAMSYLFYDECDRETVDKLNDGEHGILFHPIKVVISHEKDGWFAQGLDVDHFAQGTTEQEVKDNFANSLGRAIVKHLNKHGHLGFLALPAPPEEWKSWDSMEIRFRKM